MCASGNRAFAAIRASSRLPPSRTPMRTNICSPALATVLGTSIALEAVHTGLNGLLAKMLARPSRKIGLGCTTMHTVESITVYHVSTGGNRPSAGRRSHAGLGQLRNKTNHAPVGGGGRLGLVGMKVTLRPEARPLQSIAPYCGNTGHTLRVFSIPSAAVPGALAFTGGLNQPDKRFAHGSQSHP